MNLKTFAKQAVVVLGMLALSYGANAQVAVNNPGAFPEDPSPVTSPPYTFTISGLGGNVTSISLNVRFSITEEYGEAQVMFGKAGGTAVDLTNGGLGPLTVGNYDLTFSSTGTGSWTGGQSGSFALSSFATTAADGTWNLQMLTGTVGAGSLTGTTTLTVVPEPGAYAAAFGLVAIGVAAYRRRMVK